MAFRPYAKYKVGDTLCLARDVSSGLGVFEKDTRVWITGIVVDGYNFIDIDGNKCEGAPFDIFEKPEEKMAASILNGA